MWWVCIVSDPKFLPPRNVIPGDVGIVRRVLGITRHVGDDAHRTYADNAFKGEVCLITTSVALARLRSPSVRRLTRVRRRSHL